MITMTTVELMKPVELKYKGRKSIVPPIIEFSNENTVDIVELIWYVDGSAFRSNAGPPPIFGFIFCVCMLFLFLGNLLSRKKIGQKANYLFILYLQFRK